MMMQMESRYVTSFLDTEGWITDTIAMFGGDVAKKAVQSFLVPIKLKVVLTFIK